MPPRRRDDDRAPRGRRAWRRVGQAAALAGLCAGLALAPAVGDAVRSRPFDTDPAGATSTGVDETVPPSTPAAVTDVQAAAAGSATGPDAGSAPRPSAAPAPSGDLPEFTHRSATIEDTAGRPARLRIDALGVDAPVVATGRAADGQLDVPTDGATVVWYREGSVPGAAGSAVLAAHVDYAGQPGVFYDLEDLRPGDTVEVTLDDGRTLTFDVVRRRRYTKVRLPVRRLFTRNGDAVLTLITCGGQFNTTTRHYDSNTVVQATLR